MSNLAKVILSLINNYKKKNNEAGLKQISIRIDILFAAGSLTEEEYEILKTELPSSEE